MLLKKGLKNAKKNEKRKNYNVEKYTKMRKITQKRVRLRKTRKITYTFFALKNCETTRTRRKYNDVQTAKL